MKSLAEAVHARLAPLAERLIHGSGSRILMFDDDRAFGIN
jgi:hypothetical protein